jgi:allantoicase
VKGSFVDLVDLASERLGGAVVAANDEFFAAKDRLIVAGAAVWREGEYTERGKWMDGWETRRRREVVDDSHDWCVLRLGARGTVRGVDVDTSFFTGNFPAAFALDACDLPDLPAPEELARAPWRELLPRTPLTGDSHNLVAVVDAPVATHLRLRIFPDGGVARLRAYGDVVADWARLAKRGDVDLAAAEHGGIVVGCSDMFFGSRHNLIMPGDATHMGDGWETRRRRGPGHDWTIIRLGAAGTIRRVEVDTRHFKGNAPGACRLDASAADQALLLRSVDPGVASSAAAERPAHSEEQPWTELLPRTSLQPDARHTFEEALCAVGDVTHVRFNIFPDGGVGRLRLFGRPRP